MSRAAGIAALCALTLLVRPALADDAPLRLQVPQNSTVRGTVDGANATARRHPQPHARPCAAPTVASVSC